MDHFPSLDDYRLKDEPLRPAAWLGFNHGDRDPCVLEQYPLDRGWEPAQIQALRYQKINNQFSMESLAMIQSWMFLGALEALTLRHISEADFLRRKLKRAVVHTGFLRSYLVDWIMHVRGTPEIDHESLVVRISHILREIQFWCYKLAASVSSSTIDVNSRSFLPSEVDSAARLLTLVGETINSAKAHLHKAVSANTRGFVGCYTPDEATRVVIRLVNKGWCPYMARMLSDYRYSVAEYAAFFNKLSSKSMPSHKDSQCTEDRCFAYDVGSDYKTRHVTANCCCPFVSPPLTETMNLLSEGKIPVVSLKDPKGETIELEISCSTTIDAKGYVAFSHVWSDGMGSVTERGLPQCVLQALLGQAQGYGRQHIWIDSLCVPEEETSRRRAIQLMAKTYEDASITIVLDSSMRTISFDLTPRGIEHTLLNLVTATWMQRLWTLQEACLSRVLIFQFKNTMATSVDIFLGLVKALNDHWHVNPVLQTLANEFLKLIRPTEDTAGWISKELELGDLSRMLQRRRTSKLVDETAAVARLVHVDVKPLLETKNPEERMKIFLAMLHKIPSDIIMSPLPRLRHAGFNWAPKSFMSDESTNRRWALSTGDRVQWAECPPEGGLRGRYVLTTLSDVVRLDESNAVVYQIGQHFFKAILAGPSVFKDETCEFNTVATSLPHTQRGSLSGFQLAAALMPTNAASTESWKTELATYEYKGRIQIAVYSWGTVDDQDHLLGVDEGIRDICIV